MDKEFLLLLLLVILGSGCSSTIPDDLIDLTRRDSVSITDFVDRIDVVQLETNSQCFIRDINKLIFYEDNFYILDARQQAVLCFTNTGKFRYKIHSVGRGPEEYSYLEDFNIDSYNDRLMLLNPFGEILYYDLEGNFIEKVALPSDCRAYNEVHAINRDTLLFVTLTDFHLAYYSSSNNKILKREFPIDPRFRSLSPLGKMSQYRDSIYYNSSIMSENEMYNLSSDNLSVDYIWNFGKLNYTEGQKKNLYDNYIREQDTNRKPLRLADFVGEGKILNYYIRKNHETARYRLALVMVGASNDGETNVLVLYDKKKKSYNVIEKTTEGICLYYVRSNINTSIVLWYFGSTIDYKYYDMSVLNEEQREIINNHNEETDNPFLVVYHLKQ